MPCFTPRASFQSPSDSCRMMDRGNESAKLALADRKSLLRIIAFLDRKLPDCALVHSVVKAALLTENQGFGVYFSEKRRVTSCCRLEDDDISVIVGVEIKVLAQSEPKNQNLWRIVGWSSDNESLLSPVLATLTDLKRQEDFIVWSGNEYEPDSQTYQHLISEGRLNMRRLSLYSVDQYYLPVKQALSLRLSIPEDVYVKSLERCHAQTVYEHWLVRKTTTVDLVADEIDIFPSAGVFLKATNELVSWMTYFPHNGMSRLHTLEMYRCKGYASLVIRYLTKRVAQAGYVPTANVNVGNAASKQVFKSLGFERLQPWHIIHLKHKTTE